LSLAFQQKEFHHGVMLIKQMTLLFLLTSCAFFKARPSLKSQDPEKLLNAVRLTGEGKGRLTLGQSQYVFGVESALKENFDWILGVTIPLHGEEVMIFPNLKDKDALNEETESFEQRIQVEFRRLKLDGALTSKQFLDQLRTLIRFTLSPAWGQKRNCQVQQEQYECIFEGEKFLVDVNESQLTISKSLGDQKNLQLIAKNLTDSFFHNTDLLLYTNSENLKKKSSSFSLELFW
jgi:hypothetical protein